MKSPCLDCNELTKGSRCEECSEKVKQVKMINLPDTQPAASARGYDWAWTKLSVKARKLQPFCTDCGSLDDLQADHTPEAWRRKEKRLTIRLQDIDVVCGPCNRARGAARGSNARSDSKS